MNVYLFKPSHTARERHWTVIAGDMNTAITDFVLGHYPEGEVVQFPLQMIFAWWVLLVSRKIGETDLWFVEEYPFEEGRVY